MATSFVKHKGFGFWCNDIDLRVWLFFLIDEIDQKENMPDWIKEIRKEWHREATIGLSGSINLELDKIATTEDRKEMLIEIAYKTNERLKRFGDFIPLEVINFNTPLGQNYEWSEAPRTAFFIKVGILFIDLLKSKLKTTASSPLDYLTPDAWLNID